MDVSISTTIPERLFPISLPWRKFRLIHSAQLNLHSRGDPVRDECMNTTEGSNRSSKVTAVMDQCILLRAFRVEA